MKRFTSLFAAVLLMVSVLLTPDAFGQQATLAPLSRAAGKAVPDHYIVVMKEGADARAAASAGGIKPKHVYTSALNGFAAELNGGQLTALRRNPGVAYVEQDQEVAIDATQTMDANGDPWGLDRIDQRNLPLNGTFNYYRTGAGVHAYIIDTGIAAHSQFGTRLLSSGYTAISDTYGLSDCNGHGTHVAGTVGGTTYGVAKSVFLHSVRVLNCSGSGTTSGVIAGVDWVRLNAIKPAVANMSLGGAANTSLNTAVANLISSGVFTAVAGGNSSSDACTASPAGVATAYTVASSDRTDTRAASSAHGPCIDSYAPGVAIKSTWLNNSTNTISGTSMASPHVAGCAAQYLQANPNVTPANITTWLNTSGTMNKIINNPINTVNRLLYCYRPDVWVRDAVADTGLEPDPAVGLNIWTSPDIWNRYVPDAGTVHQAPQMGSNHLYAYVRNRGLGPDSGTLHFYAQNSGIGQPATGWVLVGSVSVVNLLPGETRMVGTAWNITAAGHYCIQVRWVSSADPLKSPLDVRNDNNVAQRNMENVYLSIGKGTDINVGITNPGRVLTPQRLVFSEPREQWDNPLVRHGRVTIDLGREVFERWMQGGGQGHGFERVGETQFVLTDPAGAVFDGLMLEPEKTFNLTLTFDAFTIASGEEPFRIDALQYDAEQEEPIGGIAYNIYLPRE